MPVFICRQWGRMWWILEAEAVLKFNYKRSKTSLKWSVVDRFLILVGKYGSIYRHWINLPAFNTPPPPTFLHTLLPIHGLHASPSSPLLKSSVPMGYAALQLLITADLINWHVTSFSIYLAQPLLPKSLPTLLHLAVIKPFSIQWLSSPQMVFPRLCPKWTPWPTETLRLWLSLFLYLYIFPDE